MKGVYELGSLDPEFLEDLVSAENRIRRYELPNGCKLRYGSRGHVGAICDCGWDSGMAHRIPSQAIAHLMLHRAGLTTVPHPMPPEDR